MARTDSPWENVGGYLQTTAPLGYNILINGTDRYLNWGVLSGTTGYGIRDNAGAIEVKSSGGAWASIFTSAGGTITGDLTVTGTTILQSTTTVGGVAKFADGAVGAPSIAFTTDPTTGLYHTGTGATGSILGAINGVKISELNATGLNIFGEIHSQGLTWSLVDTGLTDGGRWTTYGNGLFVSIGGTTNTIRYSPDGKKWTNAPSAATYGAGIVYRAIAYGDGLFVAVGNGAQFIISNDGINWRATAVPNNNYAVIAYGDGRFVAASSVGGGTIVSSDGVNWTTASAPAYGWSAITYGNGLFVMGAIDGPVGYNGAIATSPDGVNWTEQTLPTTDNRVRALAYGNGIYVATGYNGTGTNLMYSTDAVTWTTATDPTSTNRWYGLAYGNGLFVAVSNTGTGNRVITSTDGINWTVRASSSDNSWYHLAYGNGIFVAVSTTNDDVMVSGKMDKITEYSYPKGTLTYGGKEVRIVNPYSVSKPNLYKGNTHSHSTGSTDGVNTPTEVMTFYKGAGYDFNALTDHEVVTADPAVAGILFILGVEDGLGPTGRDHMSKIGPSVTATVLTDDQASIDQALSENAHIQINHPDGTTDWPLDTVLRTHGQHSVEIWNGVREQEYATEVDAMLDKGRHLNLIAAEDLHDISLDTSGKQGLQVWADSLSVANVITSLWAGNYYSTYTPAGQTEQVITVKQYGNEIIVTSNQSSTFVFYGKGTTLQTNTAVTSATYKIVGDEKYVRVRITSGTAVAWTNPIYVEQVDNESPTNLSVRGNQYITGLGKFADGAVGAPSVTTINDPLKGLYFTGTGATGSILAAINGVNGLALTATGLGIGVTPVQKLTIGGTGSLLGFYNGASFRSAIGDVASTNQWITGTSDGDMVIAVAGGTMAKINLGPINGNVTMVIRNDGNVGIGTATPNTKLHVAGGITRKVTAVAAATYDLLITDDILDVTYTATGAVTSLTLPTAQMVAGRTIVIKDGGGLAGTNNITIDTEGAETIDGQDTYVMRTNYQSINLTVNAAGTGWLVF